jgi:hypothetical protein
MQKVKMNETLTICIKLIRLMINCFLCLDPEDLIFFELSSQDALYTASTVWVDGANFHFENLPFFVGQPLVEGGRQIFQ